MALGSIRLLVKPDLEATDQFICDTLQSEVPFINQLMEYILKCGGKRIRPLLVLLTARAFEQGPMRHIELAAAIELIHTATLLHDDVVDHSSLRRGHSTANAIWGNEASVLVGDFLYSRAFQLIVKLRNTTVLEIFSNATNLIAEGEVLQLLHRHDPDTNEAAYFKVIERKTAKLFEVATQTGAALSGDSPHFLEAMRLYGLNLGLAYQLIDDALDYRGSETETGKNIGNDLTEGKATLPLIYAMQKSPPEAHALVRRSIQLGSIENLSKVIEIIESTGAIEYTAAAAKKHALKAIQALAPMPRSSYRQALEDLSEFVVERTY